MNSQPTILVVDDEQIVCDSCRRILKEEGFAVEATVRPKEGLEMVKRQDYAAVLLDMKMSEIDGLEFLGRLRERKPFLPVIIITGYPSEYSAAACMKLGARDYIAKPFSPAQITEAVRRAVNWPQPAAPAPRRGRGTMVEEAPAVAAGSPAVKVLACRVDCCLACRSCELACATAHSISQSLPEAIREHPRPQRRVSVEAVSKRDLPSPARLGPPALGTRGLPLQCRHCEDGLCELLCPTGAIHRDERTGLTLIDQDLCIGCKLCQMMCPLGVLRIDEGNRASIKCDQCLSRQAARPPGPGDASPGEAFVPACVAACPTRALQLVEQSALDQEDRQLAAISVAATLTGRDAAPAGAKVLPPKARAVRGAGKRRVVVVGANAAGAMAAIHAARAGAKVTLITDDPVSYRRPAIPALIAGKLDDIRQAAIFARKTLEASGVQAITHGRVIAANFPRKRLTVLAPDGQKQEIAFDAAVLATGSLPGRPEIPGADKPGVCTFTTAEGAMEILRCLDRMESAWPPAAGGQAVVVGASFVALEVAQALMERGVRVYFNVRSRILRRLLEPDLSEFLQERFEQQGLRMLAGETISEIGGSDRVEYVVHKGRQIPAQLVVLGTGILPRVDLVQGGPVKLAASGAIAVDNRMLTSAPDVYAAGDCAEVPDFSTAALVYSPVGSTGAVAGAIAGINAAGGNEKTDGLLRAQADHILGYQVYSVGHSSTTAREAGLEVQVHPLPAPAEVQASPEELRGKLLADPQGRIVGAQAITRRHGSQYGWQLYRAVLLKLSREEFLRQWSAPRRRAAELLEQGRRGRLVVPD